MKVIQVNRIADVSGDQWNQLQHNGDPFLSYEFLSALESTGAVSEHSGWWPEHCLIYDDKTKHQKLIAAMPMYKKDHSMGEYVFDHDWAYAYRPHGLNYYPKWVTSIPFTPCEGNRMLVGQGTDEASVCRMFIEHLQNKARQNNISSWHCLFPCSAEKQLLEQQGLSIREGMQYRWYNRDYSSFEDYLSTFNSKNRKKINRERRRIHEQEITLQQIPGTDIENEHWRAFFQFYQMTYAKRHMPSYLDISFFYEIGKKMADKLLLIMAIKDKRYVGAALSFIGNESLYGRYWGCYDQYHSLHFETCYYQGLEYCIKNKLKRFDSGAQGEHKISRGFEPVTTYSAHWIKNLKFAKAIDRYVRHEATMLEEYKSRAVKLLPFKNILP